ncbi:MAG: glutathione S-transferase [Pseudomonadota bacterium]|nr:glutathione S-transferase [Pseudomonadota bacterium]
MKLLYSAASPFARMCLVTAHELGMSHDLEIEQVVGTTPIAAHPELTKVNPLGRIPALVTDHGHALHDSRVICEYLCHRAGDKKLLPDEPVKRFRVLTIQALGQGMGDAAVALRYETATRPQTARWHELIARLRLRLTAACDDLEANWMKDLTEVSAGSIAVGCAASYMDFRHGDLDWRRGRPKLTQWFEAFGARPAMQATQPH